MINLEPGLSVMVTFAVIHVLLTVSEQHFQTEQDIES